MKKKVFVSGCYDLLHSGHVEFFQQASRYGDLIIALKQYRLYHSNDTASLAWLQVSLFTWLAIPV